MGPPPGEIRADTSLHCPGGGRGLEWLRASSSGVPGTLATLSEVLPAIWWLLRGIEALAGEPGSLWRGTPLQVPRWRPSASGSRSVPISCHRQSCHIHSSQARPLSLWNTPCLLRSVRYLFCPNCLSRSLPALGAPRGGSSCCSFSAPGAPCWPLGAGSNFLPTVAWAWPHHDPKPRLRPCHGPTQDFRVQEASERRCHHGGQRGDVFGVRLL